MIKVLTFAVVTFAVVMTLGLAAASQASASEARPATMAQGSPASAPPYAPDKDVRRAWFAHAVDDILAGRTPASRAGAHP